MGSVDEVRSPWEDGGVQDMKVLVYIQIEHGDTKTEMEAVLKTRHLIGESHLITLRHTFR